MLILSYALMSSLSKTPSIRSVAPIAEIATKRRELPRDFLSKANNGINSDQAARG
jgi:hypothetical protein